MARNRSNTRGSAHSYPRGILSVMRGGYGFVQTAEGEYFVPAGKMNGAFDGDLVEISPVRQERSRKALARAASSTRKREARVKRVIERAHTELVGRYEVAEPFGVVIPEDPRIPYDIFTLLSENSNVPDGAIVRVAMTTYPSRKEAATGVVVEVLGDDDDERLPIDLIVARYKLETEFSQAALDQAEDATVDEDGALSWGYRDLRDRFVFTIDPDDARDFDDAVSLERVDARALEAVTSLPNGAACWRLGVHIADVAHYVPWGSSVDLDARRRATSVYLVDRVIPMLPEKLSNDICSLKPGEVRRTMTVDMVLDDAGNVIDVDVYPALIRSNARLTYGQAQGMIASRLAASAESFPQHAAEVEGSLRPLTPTHTDSEQAASTAQTPSSSINQNEQLTSRVCELSRIAQKRMALREAAGGLDFDTVEAKVRLDGQGVPIEIVLRQRTEATQLIEEAMIAANEAVARFLRDASFPCIYRVHDKPSRESLDGLVPVLQEFNWFKGIDVEAFVAGNPHVIGRVLKACEGRSEDVLVTTLVLRAMKRALYEPELSGHYALASEAYCHFTSPIRRYPDLVVHRMLKAALGKRPQKFDQEVSNMPWIAEHSSEMERVAERAAAESQECKIVELMELQIGNTFSATITGVATYGLFVRLDNTAEGMVPIDDLGNEYFMLDPVRHTLTGSDSGKEYRLGRHVAVRLVEADRRTRTLRFKLCKEAQARS